LQEDSHGLSKDELEGWEKKKKKPIPSDGKFLTWDAGNKL
jgi:hypothetical protein